MSIVEGTQQRMFAFPAGQAASREGGSSAGDWSGRGQRDGGRRRGLQLKRGRECFSKL